jgi:uncharacterized membrane protein YidH (DUF202 family)
MPVEDMDPGLAEERTEPAWTRTAISFAALGGAIAKISLVPGVVVMVVGVLVWGLGRLTSPAGRRTGDDQCHLLRLVAVAVVSVVALVVVLVGGGSLRAGDAPRPCTAAAR